MNTTYEDRLKERMEENYSAFYDEWSRLRADVLIEKAEEIYATQLTMEHLPYILTEENSQWLLRFQNPLELMRNKWFEINGIGSFHDSDIDQTIRVAMDDKEIDQVYKLSNTESPSMQQGVTLC